MGWIGELYLLSSLNTREVGQRLIHNSSRILLIFFLAATFVTCTSSCTPTPIYLLKKRKMMTRSLS